jgi:hypothetical protein
LWLDSSVLWREETLLGALFDVKNPMKVARRPAATTPGAASAASTGTDHGETRRLHTRQTFLATLPRKRETTRGREVEPGEGFRHPAEDTRRCFIPRQAPERVQRVEEDLEGERSPWKDERVAPAGNGGTTHRTRRWSKALEPTAHLDPTEAGDGNRETKGKRRTERRGESTLGAMRGRKPANRPASETGRRSILLLEDPNDAPAPIGKSRDDRKERRVARRAGRVDLEAAMVATPTHGTRPLPWQGAAERGRFRADLEGREAPTSGGIGGGPDPDRAVSAPAPGRRTRKGPPHGNRSDQEDRRRRTRAHPPPASDDPLRRIGPGRGAEWGEASRGHLGDPNRPAGIPRGTPRERRQSAAVESRTGKPVKETQPPVRAGSRRLTAPESAGSSGYPGNPVVRAIEPRGRPGVGTRPGNGWQRQEGKRPR